MNYQQERKLNMYLLLQQFVAETPTTTLDVMPNFSTIFSDFNTAVEGLNTNSGRQQLQRGGSQVQKTTVREQLALKAVVVANKVKAYAGNNSNDVLFEEVNYTKSSLLICAETLCLTRCIIIHDKARALMTDLAAYGITDSELDGLRDQYMLFDSLIPKPQQGIVGKKIATQDLRTSFKNCDGLLEHMNLLVQMVLESHPEFYHDFVATKRLILPAYHTLSARGVVVDTTGSGIALATMYCEALSFKRKVSEHGGFYLKNMPDGVYAFTFSRPGYASVTQDLTFYSGTRDEVRVVLNPI